MSERSAHSRFKLPPSQWQKEKSAHPASSLRTSTGANWMPACLAEKSSLGGRIVHSNEGALDISSAIGILCTPFSRTAELLIAMEAFPPDFCSLLKSPERLKRHYEGSTQTLSSHPRCGPRIPPQSHLLPLARPAVWLPGAMLDSAK